MSEANKGEALRCLEIAKKKLSSGSLTAAQKFLKKSLKLYATNEAQSLLNDVDAQIASGGNPSRGASASSSNSSQSPPMNDGFEEKKAPSDDRSNEGERSFSESFSRLGNKKSSRRMTSEQQKQEVRRILRTKDYYKILEVSKDVTDAQLEKAYKKKAFKLHPDKNKAEGAEEAFKKVAQAYDTLKDKRRRQIYDQYGPDAPQMRSSGGHNFQHMTPDDIFAAFFGHHPFMHQRGGGFGFGPGGGTHFTFHSGRPGRRRSNGEQQNGGVLLMLMQLLPLLLIIFSMAIPSLMTSSRGGFNRYNENNLEGSVFSMTHSYPFNYRRESSKGTTYYVARNFDYKYSSRSISKIEEQVEARRLDELIRECKEEKDKNDRIRKSAQNPEISNRKRVELLKQLKSTDSASRKLTTCQELDEYLERL